MKVLAWPAYANRYENPYNALLYGAMKQYGVEVHEFSLARLLFGSYSIWHLHWPEGFLVRRSCHERMFALIRLFAAVCIARFRGIRIIWTLHNAAPHQSVEPWLLGWFHHMMTWACNGVIVLSWASLSQLPDPVRVRLQRRPLVRVLHGHYAEAYGPKPSRVSARLQLGWSESAVVFLQIGRIQPYKGVEELITLFRQTALSHQRLVLAGKPQSPDFANLLVRLVGGDPRIELQLRHVANEDIPMLFAGADYAVASFRKVTNSGSVLLGVSYGIPVLVPSTELFEEWGRELGSEAIVVYQHLNFSQWPETSDIELVARCATQAQRKLDWAVLAAETVGFYKSLLKCTIP